MIIKADGVPKDATARDEGILTGLDASCDTYLRAGSAVLMAGVPELGAETASHGTLNTALWGVVTGDEIAAIGLLAKTAMVAREVREATRYAAGFTSLKRTRQRLERETLEATSAYEGWMDSNPDAASYEDVKADFEFLVRHSPDIADQLAPPLGRSL